MRRFRELEYTGLHAGLGVQLIDEYTNSPAFGPRRVFLDADDAGTWREVPPEIQRQTTTPGGVIWFPHLEHLRDARDLPARRYRVRVAADYYTPAYLYEELGEGVVVEVHPYDDVTPPAKATPPVEIGLLPNASYPFGPGVPVLRGKLEDHAGASIHHAQISWLEPLAAPGQPQVVCRVLSDEDGEFSLPLRRTPLHTTIEIEVRRPPPPSPDRFQKVKVLLPDDLSKLKVMKID